MMLVTGPHRNLYATLNRILDEKVDPMDRKSKTSSSNNTRIGNIPPGTTTTPTKSWVGKKLKSKSIGLYDFGSKIDIIVRQERNRSKIDLQVSLQKGCTLHEETIHHLTSLYGSAITFSSRSPLNNKTDDDESDGRFSFSITVNDAVGHFDSAQSCAHSLSQIRVQAAGAPILNALHRIDSISASKTTITSSTKDIIYNLGTHGTTGSYHCISSCSKAMMVYRVCFDDEMERSLARLLLQELQNTQSDVASTPYCEYRRPNDMTDELKMIVENDAQKHQREKNHGKLPQAVGFLTFTFFPSSASTDVRRLKATELVVNFLPYLDRHVKSMKSMMLSHMRLKKNDLLNPMM